MRSRSTRGWSGAEAARRALERLTRRDLVAVLAEPGDRGRELRARLRVGDRGAVALELVGREVVVAGPDVETLARDLHVVRRAALALGHRGGRGLVRALVLREADVAVRGGTRAAARTRARSRRRARGTAPSRTRRRSACARASRSSSCRPRGRRRSRARLGASRGRSSGQRRFLRMIALRPATADDIPAVLAFWREATAEPSSTDDAARIEALLARSPGSLILAVDDRRWRSDRRHRDRGLGRLARHGVPARGGAVAPAARDRDQRSWPRPNSTCARAGRAPHAPHRRPRPAARRPRSSGSRRGTSRPIRSAW